MNSKQSKTPTSLLNRSRSNSTVSIDSSRKKQLAAFQKTAGIRFKSLELLNLSFVHRSALNETSYGQSNERLEFLGDSILGAACATLLYQRFPDKPEGDLAKVKSVTVSEEVLSAVALEIQLDSMLLLGKGEENSGGRKKKAILADAMEALIGALYLDSGYKAAFALISRCFVPEICRITEKNHHRDYKSLLQEACQQRYREYPRYRLIKYSGPEHERTYWMEVTAGGAAYGPGTGRTKKTAEQEAAKIALEKIESCAI